MKFNYEIWHVNKCPDFDKIKLSISLWFYNPCGPWPLFQFFNLYTVGRTPWTGDQPVAMLLYTHRTTQIQNKRTQTSIPWVGFEPTIQVFEWTKTVHALVRAAIVIDKINTSVTNNMDQVVNCRYLKAAALVQFQVRTKLHRGRFSPSTSAFSLNSHPNKWSISAAYHPQLMQWIN
jgi:hypothetical protein